MYPHPISRVSALFSVAWKQSCGLHEMPALCCLLGCVIISLSKMTVDQLTACELNPPGSRVA
jgi:hypothetical protein